MESYPRPTARPVITLRFEKFSSFVEEYASHLSLGGMFISAREVRPVGQVVGLEVELGDGFRLIEGVGEVVWVRSRAAGSAKPAGMALRFQALDEQGRELVLKILEEQVKSGGEPFDIDDVPADAETGAAAPADAETGAAATTPPDPAPPMPTVSAAETVRAAETPRELDFRAPWGPDLPEIPHEVLEDPEPTAASAKMEPALPAEDPVAPEASPAIQEPALKVAEQKMPDDALRPPADETVDSGSSSAPLPPAEPTAAREATPSYSLPESPRAEPSPAVAPKAAAAVAATSEVILGYEDDLFRDDLPVKSSLAATTRSMLASGARFLAALLLLAVVAGALYYRQSLARLAGLAGPSPPEPPAAAAPAEESRVQPEAAVETLASGADPALRPPSQRLPDAAPDSPPPSANQGGAGVAAEASSPIQNPDTEAGIAAAQRVEAISWRSTAAGTEVTLDLDGPLGDRRITHDRLEWAPDREQVTLAGIDFPYSPGTVRVETPELRQIRTGLHSAGGDSELRLVFDFSVGDAAITDLRELGDRIQLVVRRPVP